MVQQSAERLTPICSRLLERHGVKATAAVHLTFQTYAVNLFAVGMTARVLIQAVVLQVRRVITISSTTTPLLRPQALVMTPLPLCVRQ